MRTSAILTVAILSLPVAFAGCDVYQSMGNAPEKESPISGPNTLTTAEQQAGWQLLFDGKDAGMNFRAFRGTALPKEWAVEDGSIVLRGKGGDIVTKDEYSDFEFSIDWKITPGGNSGIFWHASEEFGAPWETGPEMQILDDGAHNDGKDRLTSAGADYALYPAPLGAVKPVGQWNQVRIVVNGMHIQYFLNGVKTRFLKSSGFFRLSLSAAKLLMMSLSISQ